ncbi:MAG: TIGR00282 family metallophosphoesterase [Eubacteriales bacterium]
MHVLLIGDVVGRAGRRAVKENIPGLIKQFEIDFIIANGENAAGGNGLTHEVANELFACGIDVLTMGNHVWDQKEIFSFINKEDRVVRPANFPAGAPGNGINIFKNKQGESIGVMNLSGRVFMPGNLDCPFHKADELLARLKDKVKALVVDFHAEATSEKIAFGLYLDGRVSAVCGTHTHVQTADEKILPGGTAYISDVGMTGPSDSVIGVKADIVIEKFLTQLPRRFEVAPGPYQFNAVIIEIDASTGQSGSIVRIANNE